jgi:hypothetical protein
MIARPNVFEGVIPAAGFKAQVVPIALTSKLFIVVD